MINLQGTRGRERTKLERASSYACSSFRAGSLCESKLSSACSVSGSNSKPLWLWVKNAVRIGQQKTNGMGLPSERIQRRIPCLRQLR